MGSAFGMTLLDQGTNEVIPGRPAGPDPESTPRFADMDSGVAAARPLAAVAARPGMT